MKNIYYLLFFFGMLCTAQNPQVVNVSPDPQTLDSNRNTAIILTFDTALDATTVNSDNVMVFGRWSGPMDGNINLDASGLILTFTPQRDFFYGEWISVKLSSDLESTGGDPLVGGFAYNFWIKTLPAGWNQSLVDQFSTEDTGETFIQSYGAYAGDLNHDEYTDLTVITEVGNDIRVFFNDESGGYSNFTIFNMPAANKPSTNEGADFNKDGEIDLAIGSTQNSVVSVFMGNASTTFDSEIGYQADTGPRGLAVLDIDGDGWDDIVTANRTGSTYSILKNDGTGSFNAAITQDAGVSNETSIAAVDLNNDGFIDLAIGGFGSNNVLTLLNDGAGNFTPTDATPISGSPWMLAAGDVNNDGEADIVSVNSSSGEVSILTGDGTGFLSVSGEYPVGSFSLAIDLGDNDGDGDLDFIASNFGTNDFVMYENDGSGGFINPTTYPAVQAGSCAIFHDRNNDGAMDLTLIDELEDVVILYENTPILDTEDFENGTTLKITPNPFTDRIQINTASDAPYQFRLMDLQGRVLISKQLESKTINLSDIPIQDGLFIAEIVQDGKSFQSKIIKIDR